MNVKYLITSAGLGSRLGAYSKHKNKSLITLGTKPAISHIIDKIEHEAEIVIALGYKGDLVRTAVSTLHPSRNITYINVENFDGPGSGLGHSMLCCEKHLQSPFIYIPNDTIIPNTDINIDPNKIGDWIGTYRKKDNDSVEVQQYRCVEQATNTIHPKGIITDTIYIGLCGVQDYQKFWSAMKAERAILEGESYGLNMLPDRTSINIEDWYDTGNITSLQKAEKKYISKTYNILPKENEAIWIKNDIIVKYHDDPQFIHDRVKRAMHMASELYPQVEKIHPNLYYYKKIDGDVFSKNMSNKKVTNLLNQLEKNLWSRSPDLSNDQQLLEKRNIVDEFYISKTIERLRLFENRFEVKLNDQIINDVSCPSPFTLIDQINKEALSKSLKLGEFHGDLHGENIILEPDNVSFKLIDWRQNFGNDRYHYGDVYYDLAKFMHGLIVSHEAVNNNDFSVEHLTAAECKIDIQQSLVLNDAQQCFFNWLDEHNYDTDIVRLITALIYLNIAALHHHPYSKFLLYLGQYQLACYLETK